MRAVYVFLMLVPAAMVACGSDDNAVPDSGGDESTADVTPDAGPLAFPAFTIDAPQVAAQGGPVLNSPKVQPVFFPGFDFATQMTSFTSKLGASVYWQQLAEYKVGSIVANTPIALTSSQIAPADIGNITDAYIQSWLQARFDGTHPEFGTTPDASTIYALFYPTQTVISLGGGGGADGGGFNSTSCHSFGGYHGEVVVNGTTIPYAVIPECPTFGSFTGIDAETATASHEFAEAATDPFPNSLPAYAQVDNNHLAWMSFLGGGEIGDMCAQFPTSFYVPADLNFIVQRSWSNANALLGKDPCQPADTSPYFNAMPVFNDMVQTRFGVMTKGIVVPVGTSKTLEVDLFSDSVTNTPWKVSAKAYARGGASVPVTLAFDNTTGQNGDKVNLTITSTGAFTSTTHTATLVITSSTTTRENIWIGYIGQ